MRIALIVLVFTPTLYILLDCTRTPDESIPARMPKYLWIALVVLFPTIGPITWIIFSQVRTTEERDGYVEPTVWFSKESTTFRRPQRPRPTAPGDDPEFLRDLEQDIRRHKHHPQKHTGAPDASNGGADEDPKTGGTGGTGRSGTDSH